MNWEIVIPLLLVSGLTTGAIVALAARAIPRIRPWAIVVALAAAAFPVAIVLHNVLSALIRGEEAVSFIVALVVAPAGIAVGAIGAGLAIARERLVLGASVLVAGTGLALFELYGLFALIVTTLEGGNPPYQAYVEGVVVPLAVLAAVAGALSALVSMLAWPTRTPAGAGAP